MNRIKDILEALEKNEGKVVEIANELSKEGQVNAFKVFKKIKGEIKVEDSFKVIYGRKIREIISKKKKKSDGKPGRSLKEWIADLKKQDAPKKVIDQFKAIHDSVIKDGGDEEHAMRAAIDKLPKKYIKKPTEVHGPKKKKYPLSESLEEDIFKMLLEGKTEDQIREKYKDELDEFFIEATHISVDEFMKNFKCAYPDMEIPEEDLKLTFDAIYPELEEKSEKPEEITICEVVKAVYDKLKGKTKKKGPGGHEPDGSGPPEHGRGMGPGEGKGDGSGLE